ncbi:hypothetical protein Tco_0586122 [Tanacetum coccineum]
MRIPDAFVTDEIRATDDYKEYEMVFVGVEVPMNQPKPVVSTQETHRTTPRAHRTPTLTAVSPQGKKRKQSAGETSSPRKSFKVTIRQKKHSTTLIPPPSDDRERDEIAEATLLSLTLHKTVLVVEAQENVAKVQEKLADEGIEKMVEGEEDKEPLQVSLLILCLMIMMIPSLGVIRNIWKFGDDDENKEEKKDRNKDNEMGRINVHPTTSTSIETISSTDLQQQLYLKMNSNLQDKANDPALWDVLKLKDSTTYVSKQQHEWDAWEEKTVIDKDEVIPKDETPELITEFQNIDKRVPTIFDRARMEATLNDMLSNQFRNAEEYAYHLEQAANFMENQMNGNTKNKKYILSLHKIHTELFPEADLEEKMNRWVCKEFKNFNEDAWLSIQHWKDSWHKRVYKQIQRKVRDNPEDYFSNHTITEVVRITTDQQYGLDFMEQIIMMRENDKPDSFSEADFKYLNKDNIEDLYYLCWNKKVNYRETKLMNSLITFIRSRVI